MDIEYKPFQDFYFNYEGSKLLQKVVYKWFFQEFQHLLLQSTISKTFFKIFE